VLVGHYSTIPTIIEEGFQKTQILAFDDNIERGMRLSDWVRQHDGVLFQFPLQESDRYESESDMAQGKEDHEAHNDTMDDDDDEDDDDNDEDDHDDDDNESDIDNNDDKNNTISLFEPEVVALKKTGTKRKRKNPVLINIVGLKGFVVENTQPL
jgi:TATA-binding protein-associated factor Taf7